MHESTRNAEKKLPLAVFLFPIHFLGQVRVRMVKEITAHIMNTDSIPFTSGTSLFSRIVTLTKCDTFSAISHFTNHHKHKTRW